MWKYQEISTADVECNPREQLPLKQPTPNAVKSSSSLSHGAALLLTILSVALLLVAASVRLSPGVSRLMDHDADASLGGAGNLFDWAGRYILRNFDTSSAMANFLPGLGGYWGTNDIPLFSFMIINIMLPICLRCANVGFLR